MSDYPVYQRKDGAQYTGLADHSGHTPTPLMTDRKYNGIAETLKDPHNSPMRTQVDAMAQAMERAKNGKESFRADQYLQDKPPAFKKFLADLEVRTGASLENIRDVHSDLKKPIEAQAGRQRAVSVGGHLALPDNVGAIQRVTKQVASSFAKNVVGRAGAVLGAGAALAGGASAAEVADSVLPTNFAGKKSLCHQFMEASSVVGGAAAGLVTANPAVGLAAGLAIEGARPKLTEMVCGQ